MRTGCIYKFTNKVNGKVYIGKTLDWKRRKREHKSRFNNSKNRKNYFGRALIKHGWDNFKIEIMIDNNAEDKMNALEIYFIQTHKSSNSKFGYNCTLGGDGVIGYKFTAEQCEERRKRNTKNHSIPGGGTIFFCKNSRKWIVTSKHPERKSVGKYFTKERSEEALALYNTTGKIMPSDSTQRKSGTGSISKLKSGQFRARCKGTFVGLYLTKEKSEEALDLYNTTGKRMPSDIKTRRKGTGSIIKTKSGRYEAVYKRKYVGTFDTKAEAEEALEKIWRK